MFDLLPFVFAVILMQRSLPALPSRARICRFWRSLHLVLLSIESVGKYQCIPALCLVSVELFLFELDLLF